MRFLPVQYCQQPTGRDDVTAAGNSATTTTPAAFPVSRQFGSTTEVAVIAIPYRYCSVDRKMSLHQLFTTGVNKSRRTQNVIPTGRKTPTWSISGFPDINASLSSAGKVRQSRCMYSVAVLKKIHAFSAGRPTTMNRRYVVNACSIDHRCCSNGEYEAARRFSI